MRLKSSLDAALGIQYINRLASDILYIKIIDRNGHMIRKSALSAGEKEVFAVSLLWGLAQTSEQTLPIIIDTPLSRLDSTHRDNIVNNYFPNAGEQLVMALNNTAKHANSHLAIMGKPGVGKTQFLLNVLTDIRIQSNYQTN